MKISKWIAALSAAAFFASGKLAMAMEQAEIDPATHGPEWLSAFAAICGVILSVNSLLLIYMMVSGKAGKYTE